jgi:hypothetical protein
MSLGSRIDRLTDMLSAPDPEAEPLCDEDLARMALHCLSGVIAGHRTATDEDLALAAQLDPANPQGFVDSLIASYESHHAAKRQALLKTWGDDSATADPARDYTGASMFQPTAVPQIPRQRDHPLDGPTNLAARAASDREALSPRERHITSPEFELERAANMGRSEMIGGGPRQDRALTGPRRFRK